jgi:hypothetical protein
MSFHSGTLFENDGGFDVPRHTINYSPGVGFVEGIDSIFGLFRGFLSAITCFHRTSLLLWLIQSGERRKPDRARY